MRYRAAGVHKLLGTGELSNRWYNFYPCTPTLRATMQSVTDGRTDRIHDDVNSRSDCVAVRSAKKYYFKMLNFALVLDIFCRYIVHGIQTHEALAFSF